MSEYVQTISVRCPRCGSSAVMKRGHHDGKQTFACKECARRFFRSDETLDGRAKQIGAAVNMFYDGLSYKRIAENIAEMFDRPEPSKRTIYTWIKTYTDKAIAAMREYPAHTSDEWVADEMVLDIGGKKYWNWNVMDSRTRYVLASHLSLRRDATAAREVMRKARENSATIPKRIKTDKLRSYIVGIDAEFGGEVKHIQSEGLSAELNNNMSERLQETFRERAKTMRGLQSRQTGQRFLDGWVINYNVFRPHESLKGRTPAQAAHIYPPFKEWEDLAKPRTRAFTTRNEFKKRRGFEMTALNVQNRTLAIMDNLRFLRALNNESIDLITIDPPFAANETFTGTPRPPITDAEIAEEKALAAKHGVEHDEGRKTTVKDIWTWDADVHPDWLSKIEDQYPSVFAAIKAVEACATENEAAYIAFMAVRLIECQRVLKPTGSIYVHCDDHAR